MEFLAMMLLLVSAAMDMGTGLYMAYRVLCGGRPRFWLLMHSLAMAVSASCIYLAFMGIWR